MSGPVLFTASPRHPKWPAAARRFLKRNPLCMFCGGTKEVVVHHAIPFHIRPDLEMDESLWRPCCELAGVNCHLQIAHLGDWRLWRKDLQRGLVRLKEQRTALRLWIERERARQ